MSHTPRQPQSEPQEARSQETLAEVVRALRAWVGETQAVFAKRVNRSRPYIADVERGRLHAATFRDDLLKAFPKEKKRINDAYDTTITRLPPKSAPRRETALQRKIEVFLNTGRFGYAQRAIEECLASHHRSAFQQSEAVLLQMMGYLWEQLGSSLPGQLVFDAVLVIGNSLCLVPDADRRQLCIQALYDSLKPGGVLVIDERNYAAMLDRREAIEQDPVNAFKPTLHGDILYAGRSVRGYPFEITNDHIVWRFFTYDGTALSSDELRSRQPEFQDLTLYPFAYGELRGLLTNAGFAAVDVYADLTLVAGADASMPSRESVSDATFLTYVAKKPS